HDHSFYSRLDVADRFGGPSAHRAGCHVATADVLGGLVGLLDAHLLGEPALGVDRGRTTSACGGDGLPIGVVHQVARGEHARNIGIGAAGLLRVSQHVALVVQV